MATAQPLPLMYATPPASTSKRFVTGEDAGGGDATLRAPLPCVADDPSVAGKMPGFSFPRLVQALVLPR